MDSTRKAAMLAGILFIVADVAGIPGKVLSDPVLNSKDWLTVMAPNGGQIELAAMLVIIMAIACAGIAFALFPVIRKHSPGLAISSVGFRVIEASFSFVSAAILMMFLSLSQDFVNSGFPSQSQHHVLGSVLRSGNDCLANVTTITWCFGALMYSLAFFRARLLPRWLAISGLIVYPLPIIASVMVLFATIAPQDTTWIALVFPAAVQELVLAIWLVAKGFVTSPSSRSILPQEGH